MTPRATTDPSAAADASAAGTSTDHPRPADHPAVAEPDRHVTHRDRSAPPPVPPTDHSDPAVTEPDGHVAHRDRSGLTPVPPPTDSSEHPDREPPSETGSDADRDPPVPTSGARLEPPSDADAERLGPFAVSASGYGGLSRAVLRSDRYRTPTRGIRISTTAADTLELRCRAHLLALPPGTAVSGRTAAQLHRLPVRRGAGEPVEVTVPVAPPSGRTRWHPERVGLVASRQLLAEDDADERSGLRATTPARTFVDLARRMSLPDLVAVGDAIRHLGLAEPDELERAVLRARGRRGVRTARAAVPLLDGRSRSPQESRLRVILVQDGIPAPAVNATIRDAHGGFLAEGDLVWEEARVVAEYDGEVHGTERQRRRDATRRTVLRLNGWLVVELTADDLRFPTRACTRVRDALTARGLI